MKFPFNCRAPVGRDGMRTTGVNTVSVHGKILRHEIQLRGLSVRKHYRKLVGYQIPILTGYIPMRNDIFRRKIQNSVKPVIIGK